jgi:hypothetical protein
MWHHVILVCVLIESSLRLLHTRLEQLHFLKSGSEEEFHVLNRREHQNGILFCHAKGPKGSDAMT